MNSSRARTIVLGLLGFGSLSACDRALEVAHRDAHLITISNGPSSALKKDAFDLTDISVADGILRMTVVSGGGCRDHDYDLVMTPNAFMESYPVQANIYLRHDAKGDMCRAIVRDSVEFDLTPILELYEQAYRQLDTIHLNLFNYEQTQSERIILTPPD